MVPDSDAVSTWIVLACWLAFIVVWAAGWVYSLFRAPKTVRRRLSPMVLGGAVAAYAISWATPAQVWDALAIDNAPLRLVGVIVVVAGTAFAIWARVCLGVMWNGIPSQRAQHRLVTTGAYAITRHPIYAGYFAMITGTALAFGVGTWAGPVVASAVAIFFKIRDEKRLLTETFGRRYRELSAPRAVK